MLTSRRLIVGVAVFVTILLSSSSWAQPNLQLGSATGMPGGAQAEEVRTKK